MWTNFSVRTDKECIYIYLTWKAPGPLSSIKCDAWNINSCYCHDLWCVWKYCFKNTFQIYITTVYEYYPVWQNGQCSWWHVEQLSKYVYIHYFIVTEYYFSVMILFPQLLHTYNNAEVDGKRLCSLRWWNPPSWPLQFLLSPCPPQWLSLTWSLENDLNLITNQ